MLNRVGLDGQDVRNSFVVVLIMGLVIAVVVGGPVLVRLIAGLVMGLVAAVAFLVATAIINRVKPDYW